MNQNKIDVIFFDLGHVLVHVFAERAMQILAGHMNIKSHEIEAFLHQKKDVFEQFEKGLISSDNFAATLLNGAGGIDVEQFKSIYASIFELDEKVSGIVERLSKNYRLSVISNTNELHFDKINHDYAHVMQLFEKPTTSHESHMLKPDKEIYHYALSQLKCRATSAVFIDDKSENISAANEIGIHGIEYTTSEKLEVDLKKLNINL